MLTDTQLICQLTCLTCMFLKLLDCRSPLSIGMSVETWPPSVGGLLVDMSVVYQPICRSKNWLIIGQHANRVSADMLIDSLDRHQQVTSIHKIHGVS